MLHIDVEQIARVEVRKAQNNLKLLRRDAPFRDNDFAPYAVFVTSTGQRIRSRSFGFDSPQEKRIRMFGIALVAYCLQAYAVILVMDSNFVQIQVDVEPWKSMHEQAGGDPEKFNDIYQEWLHREYGGRIANMPAEMREDALIVSAMGPTVPVIGFTIPYKREKHGITFLEARWDSTKGNQFRQGMVDEWWTPEYENENEGLPRIMREASKGLQLTPEEIVNHSWSAFEKKIEETRKHHKEEEILRGLAKSGRVRTFVQGPKGVQ